MLQISPPARPDKIFVNARVLTLDSRQPEAEALATRGEVVVAVGSESEIRALAGPQTEVVDLGGNVVVPGFNDSHMHLLHWGRGMEEIDLTGARSCRELVLLGREFCSRHPQLDWVVGRGWNDARFRPHRLPARQDLDAVSPNKPVVFTRVCGHVCVANSKALELAGIGAGTPDPPGGKIDRDQAGRPTGILRETAVDMVRRLIPVPDAKGLKRILLRAARQAAAYGLTSIQTNDISDAKDMEACLKAYRELAGEGRLPVRVNLQVGAPTLADLKTFLSVREDYSMEGSHFRLGPVKLFADGSLGARTAALQEPYTDAPDGSGVCIYRQDELDGLIKAAAEAGLQVAVHAIGDRAISMALDSFQHLGKEQRAIRHRIIHCQITNTEILRRIARLGLVIDIQPAFVATDLHFVDARIGPERARTSYAWRSMLELGIPVAAGSDCPVEDSHPLRGLHAAITRQDEDGFPAGGWHPAERLEPEQALRIYTAGSAYAAREEHLKGTLSPGKLADFCVLPDSPLDVSPSELLSMPVLGTFVGARASYIGKLK